MIKKGKYRRATIDFSLEENEELETYIRSLGCHKAVFVRAAVKFAIMAGLRTVTPSPPVRQVFRDITPVVERVPAEPPPPRRSAL